jgi:hypothetical protein
VWNSILAGIVYQHPSIESLRRELLRNGQLREICGFDLYLGERVVPPAYVYTRFCRKLMICADEVEKIFLRLGEEIKTLLPDFGRVLAIDSKAINSLARGQNLPAGKAGRDEKPPKPDGRRDTDATLAKKPTGGKDKTAHCGRK